MDPNIEFYRLKVHDGEATYIAARSRISVSHLAELMGESIDTLKSVSEEEASQAKYYPKFSASRSLCADGTWVLGLSRN